MNPFRLQFIESVRATSEDALLEVMKTGKPAKLSKLELRKSTIRDSISVQVGLNSLKVC
jgi:hypothetical protein